MIDVFRVVDRHKPFPVANASRDDFTVVPDGTAPPSIVIDDPSVSLYCLDHAAKCALFVRVPDGVDVTEAPFLYMAQYEGATHLYVVPYEAFHRLAAGITEERRLVFIYSTGRAGSTLLSKAFAAMESTTSLSEPDVYSQIAQMRLHGMPDDDLLPLLRSATAIYFKPTTTRGSRLHAVKFRSYCVYAADLLAALFPEVGNLFLYRNLAAGVLSYLRAFGAGMRSPEEQREAARGMAAFAPLIGEELKRREDFDGIELVFLLWFSAMHGYARMRRQGVPMLGVRYEDLVADPASMLARILAYLHLSGEQVERGLEAFQRDSQEGTFIARDRVADRQVTIDERQWELLRALLERYPLHGADVPPSALAIP